jgi:Lon protease-like protein
MQIPLFPLHAVLTPGLALSLHVFEERYRLMVRHCLDTATPFGIVLIREGREVAPAGGKATELAIAGVGTFAEIREASRFSDGRWNLLTVGGGRFAVEEVHTGLEPYLVADVQQLEDTIGDEEAADELVQRVIRRFADYLGLLQPRDGEPALPLDVQVEVEVVDAPPADEAATAGSGPDSGVVDPDRGPGGAPDDGDEPDGPQATESLRIPEDPSQLSFLLTGILQVDPDRKQSLLEASSAEERLRELNGLLDGELALLRRRLAPYLLDRRSLPSRLN